MHCVGWQLPFFPSQHVPSVQCLMQCVGWPLLFFYYHVFSPVLAYPFVCVLANLFVFTVLFSNKCSFGHFENPNIGSYKRLSPCSFTICSMLSEGALLGPVLLGPTGPRLKQLKNTKPDRVYFSESFAIVLVHRVLFSPDVQRLFNLTAPYILERKAVYMCMLIDDGVSAAAGVVLQVPRSWEKEVDSKSSIRLLFFFCRTPLRLSLSSLVVEP